MIGTNTEDSDYDVNMLEFSGHPNYRETIDFLSIRNNNDSNTIPLIDAILDTYTEKFLDYYEGCETTLSSKINELDARVTDLENGLCIKEGSEILMADGTYTLVENLKAGDMLMSIDTETNEYVPSLVYGAFSTGTAFSWLEYYFSNGSVLQIDDHHRIYSDKKKTIVKNKDFKIGDTALSLEGEVVELCYIGNDKGNMMPRKKYTIFCSTGLYFANDILCGHFIGDTARAYIHRHGAGFTIPEDDFRWINKCAAESDKCHDNIRKNKEYLKEVMPHFKAKAIAEDRIVRIKNRLAKLDYKTIKSVQGVLSEEENAENVETCERFRAKIAIEEDIITEVNGKISEIKEKYGIEHISRGLINTKHFGIAIQRAKEKYIENN